MSLGLIALGPPVGAFEEERSCALFFLSPRSC